jgi:hypothetical protein
MWHEIRCVDIINISEESGSSIFRIKINPECRVMFRYKKLNHVFVINASPVWNAALT